VRRRCGARARRERARAEPGTRDRGRRRGGSESFDRGSRAGSHVPRTARLTVGREPWPEHHTRAGCDNRRTPSDDPARAGGPPAGGCLGRCWRQRRKPRQVGDLRPNGGGCSVGCWRRRRKPRRANHEHPFADPPGFGRAVRWTPDPGLREPEPFQRSESAPHSSNETGGPGGECGDDRPLAPPDPDSPGELGRASTIPPRQPVAPRSIAVRARGYHASGHDQRGQVSRLAVNDGCRREPQPGPSGPRLRLEREKPSPICLPMFPMTNPTRLIALPLSVLAALPASAQWTQTQLSSGRTGMSAASIGDLALFAGGNEWSPIVDTVDVYDGSTGTWSTMNLSVARYGVEATALDGKAYFAGGWDPAFAPSDVVDVFDEDRPPGPRSNFPPSVARRPRPRCREPSSSATGPMSICSMWQPAPGPPRHSASAAPR